jgi:hypothetical protein
MPTRPYTALVAFSSIGRFERSRGMIVIVQLAGF